MSSFLPETYKEPKAQSGYLKFAQGETIFRVMTPAITGWEWWTEETKDGKTMKVPHRVRDEGTIPAKAYDMDQPPKHFWAMVVWNILDNRLQILELTQRGLQKSMVALTKSKGWGDPRGYDISITKKGEKMDTEYTLMPIPPSPVPTEAIEAMKKTKINVEALFDGEDPFAQA